VKQHIDHSNDTSTIQWPSHDSLVRRPFWIAAGRQPRRLRGGQARPLRLASLLLLLLMRRFWQTAALFLLPGLFGTCSSSVSARSSGSDSA
jgi:hypothetical protein